MIHFFIPILQPYRVNFYTKLNEYYSGDVLFHYGFSNTKGRSSYSGKVKFLTKSYKEKKIKFLSYNLVYWFKVFENKINKNDIIIVQPILGNLSILFTIVKAKLNGVKIIYWVCAYEPYHNYFLRKFKNIIIKLIYSFCDEAICYSTHAYNYCLKMGLNSNQISIAYNGIDEPIYHEKSINNSVFKIGYIGAIIKEKGISKLLKATKYINSNYELNIVGDGELLNKLKLNYKDNPQIIFYGKKFENEKLLSDIDLLIIPGQGGLVALESIYQNTYVLCSDNCDPALMDVIKNKKNGEFFNSEISPIQLSEIINNLYLERPKVDEVYGKKLVKNNFTTSKMHDVFIKVINDI